MRIVAALLLVLFAVAPVAAQDDLGKRIEQARIYIDLTTADSVMGPMVDAIWPTIEMQLPSDISLEVANRLKGTFATEIKAALGDVMDDIASAYADVFTLEELTAINKFYAVRRGRQAHRQPGRADAADAAHDHRAPPGDHAAGDGERDPRGRGRRR